MGIINVTGLVLREANSGEADKIITVLTKENGKKTIVANGARRQKSPFLAGTQPFSYCKFIIYDNKNIASLNQLEIIETFHTIRNNLFKLSIAAYFMELLENTAIEEVSAEEPLKLTLKSLQILNKTDYDPNLLTRIYELRLMQIMGYMPETMQCVNCSGTVEGSIYFGAEAGGILCDKCKTTVSQSMFISIGALHSMQYILSVDLSKVFKFSVSTKVLDELTLITKNYIAVHIDHKFRTLKFLEQLNI